MMKVGLAAQTGEASPGGTQVVPPQPKPPPPPGEIARLFPQLEILECLGCGGMGAVYKARQPRLDRLVALKILTRDREDTTRDARFAERFEREARALAKLNHPNIVAMYEFGQAGGLPYFIMEYVDGLNLRQLEQAGRLAPPEALRIIPQICEALQFAHDEGIVHRDIKPENILLDKKGRVKIADFGIAKVLAPGAQDFTQTGGKDVVGTPHYMAPEQVENPTKVDHRADIYSLGVVFYEMLTGELPLGKFQPPSRRVQVDVRLDDVVLHALEKEPERRYQHASDVKSAVETIAAPDNTEAAPRTEMPDPAQASPFRQEDWRTRVAVVGVRGGKRGVHWPGVALVSSVVVSLFLTGGFLFHFLVGQPFPSPHFFPIMLVLVPGMLALAIYRGLRKEPMERLVRLDARQDATVLRMRVKAPLVLATTAAIIGLPVVFALLLNLASNRSAPGPVVAVSSPLTFGPVIERVLPFSAPCRMQYFQFHAGKGFTIGDGPGDKTDHAEDYRRAEEMGGLDVSVIGGRDGLQLAGKGCLFTDDQSPDWDTMTAEAAVRTLRRESWLNGVVEIQPKDFPVTYLFKTARGECGLLQVLGVTDDPHGMKFRYKLVQGVAAPPATPASAHIPSFDPVIERVLDFDAERKTAYLDLDTGEYVDPGTNSAAYGMKNTPAGVDLRASSVESNFDVRWGINMAVVPVEPGRWEAREEEIRMAVGSVKRQPEVRLGGGRSTHTWFFQTSEGGRGVLQFLPPKAGDDPSQVRLHYRLVKPATPGGSGAQSAPRNPSADIAALGVQQAEREFNRIKELHAQKLVTPWEYERARLAHSIAVAEQKGNTNTIKTIQLELARVEFRHASELYDKKVIGESDYQEVRTRLDIAAAEFRGDRIAVARFKLQWLEGESQRASQLYDQKLIPESDYEKTKANLQVAAAELKVAETNASARAKAETDPSASSSASDGFGPVVECVIAHDGTNAFFDLDSGQFVQYTGPKTETGQIRQGRIDLYFSPTLSDLDTLTAVGMSTTELGTGATVWSHPPSGVTIRTILEEAARRSYGPEAILRRSIIYAFGTHEGNMGLLQLLGPTEDWSGIRIRYKLALPKKFANP